jgi:hypothetical protein
VGSLRRWHVAQAIGQRLRRHATADAGPLVRRLFEERHHRRDLTTPLEVRRAIAYVMLNSAKHDVERGVPDLGTAPVDGIDPLSDARWFDGWQRPPPLADPRDRHPEPPRMPKLGNHAEMPRQSYGQGRLVGHRRPQVVSRVRWSAGGTRAALGGSMPLVRPRKVRSRLDVLHEAGSHDAGSHGPRSLVARSIAVLASRAVPSRALPIRTLAALTLATTGCIDGPGSAADGRAGLAAPTGRVSTPGGRLVPTTRRHAPAPPPRRYVIAKADGPATPVLRQALSARGYRVLRYLPEDALLVERTQTAASVPGVVDWVAFEPADRIARDLASLEALALARGGPGPAAAPTPLLVHLMPGADADAVRAVLAEFGIAPVGEGPADGFARLSLVVPAAQAPALARRLGERDEVFFVERVRRLGLLNDKSAGSVQSGQLGPEPTKTPIWEHGLRGDGQIVGVLDTGADVDSCWFDDDTLPTTNTWSAAFGYGIAVGSGHRKILAYDFLYSCDQYPKSGCDSPSAIDGWDNHGHGSHIAGSILGDQNRDPGVHALHDGLAPAARLVMQDAGYGNDPCAELPGLGCPVTDLGPLFAQAYAQGVRIHSNSYGDNENAAAPGQSNYSARSQDVDRFMWEHRDMLIIFAAGNSGSGNKDFSVGSPSTNKNGLSVGSARRSVSSSTDEDISGFSSRGVTGDGRIKPDLMAPGCNASASTNRMVPGKSCSVNSGCGTSYAAPVAAGAAALVRQYFVDGFYPSGAASAADGFAPSAALMKAMLINAAQSMTGKDNASQTIAPIPSHEQGFGRIQLDQALVFQGDDRQLFVDDHRAGLAAGASESIATSIDGVRSDRPLKITLTWTDYPGTPDSPPVQPRVDDPSSWSAPQLVNDLDLVVTDPSGTVYLGNVFTAGVAATGGEADRRNNVEEVLIAAPAPGSYTIEVVPHAIVEGDQEYALVVTGAWGPASPDAGPVGPPDGGVIVPPDSGVPSPPDSGAPSPPDSGVPSPPDSGVPGPPDGGVLADEPDAAPGPAGDDDPLGQGADCGCRAGRSPVGRGGFGVGSLLGLAALVGLIGLAGRARRQRLRPRRRFSRR